jgi:hypothetical protein
MFFDFRTFTLAKDPEHPEQNQDAWALDPRRGIATLADGVASGLFSRSWATILTESVLADAPDPADKDAWRRWLAERRAAWSARIDVDRLAWYQKAKLKEGTFSTLLVVRLLPAEIASPADGAPAAESTSPADGASPDDPPAWNVRGYAVGDTCLFFVREGKTVRIFPIETAAEFDADPLVIGSIDLSRDDLVGFRDFEERGRAGDLVVLCTDAVAAWALRRSESGQPPAWDDYWDMPEETWQAEVMSLRQQREMRYDDATLLLLRICDPRTEPLPAAAPTPAIPPLPPGEGRGEGNLPQTNASPAPQPAWPPGPTADPRPMAPAIPPLPSGEGWGEGKPPQTNAPATPQPAWAPGLTADPRLPAAPVPPAVAAPLAPAATPAPDAEPAKPVEDVAEKLKAISGEIIDQSAKQVARGLEKFKEVKKSAASTWQKYLKRFRP